jgi:hypothetical protein
MCVVDALSDSSPGLEARFFGRRHGEWVKIATGRQAFTPSGSPILLPPYHASTFADCSSRRRDPSKSPSPQRPAARNSASNERGELEIALVAAHCRTVGVRRRYPRRTFGRDHLARAILILATAVYAQLFSCALAQDASAPPAPPAQTPFEPLVAGRPAPADGPGDSGWRAKIEAARLRHADWLSCIQARRFKCYKKAPADPMDALMNDHTLVAGDIVATPSGLRIFVGSSQVPHSLADFK